MSARCLIKSALLVTGLTSLALLSACDKVFEPTALVALQANTSGTTTTLGAKVDDAVITASIKKALLADATVNSFDLQVETRGGVVQLSGFVNNQAQIAKALAIAHAVAGVKAVENSITLKGSPSTVGTKIDDATVTGRVKTVFLADPHIRSFDISVVTFKGEVQLTGFVNSQSQIDLAARLASETEGVTRVKNELMLKR